MVLRRFFVVFLGMFLLHEAGARSSLPNPIDQVERNDWLRGHPYLWYRYVETRSNSSEIGRYGFRKPDFEWRKAEAMQRVVVVGSSVVYSPYTGPERSMPALLGSELSARLPNERVESINGGFHGYTSQLSLVSVATRVVELVPDVVVFYVGDNDLVDGVAEATDPEDVSADWRREDRPKRSFQDTTPVSRWLGRESVLLGRSLARGHVRPTSLENLRWTQEPSPAGELLCGRGRYSAAFLLGALGEPRPGKPDDPAIVSSGAVSREPVQLARFHARNMRKMVQVAQDAGARTVVCTLVILLEDRAGEKLFPGEDWSIMKPRVIALREAMNANLREIARATGSITVDLEQVLEPTSKHFYDATHWNEAGNVVVARAVAEALVGAGWPGHGGH